MTEIYRCKECDKKSPCVLIVAGDSTGAQYCPMATTGKAKWERMGVYIFDDS